MSYLRLHSSCTYTIDEEICKIHSNASSISYKIKNLPINELVILLDKLQAGIDNQQLLSDIDKFESASDRKKYIDLIAFLKEKGLILNCNVLSDTAPIDALYDRQIRFFNSFESEARDGNLFNENLQSKKVVIVGLGGYGSWLALHCLRLGIKNIIGIDFDTVETSNLPRQVLFNTSDVGRLKAEVCEEKLNAFYDCQSFKGVNLKIMDKTDLLPLIHDADLVFNAFGYLPEKEALNRIQGIVALTAIEAQIPMLCLSASWLGPFYFPQESPCYFCAVNHPDIIPLINRSTAVNPRTDKRAFSPIIASTCSLACFEASQYLAGINSPKTINGICALNPFSVSDSSFIPIDISKECKFCNTSTKHF